MTKRIVTPKTEVITRDVPSVVIWNNPSKEGIPAGTEVQVIKEFWRNGEGWLRLRDGREIPDVFTI